MEVENIAEILERCYTNCFDSVLSNCQSFCPERFKADFSLILGYEMGYIKLALIEKAMKDAKNLHQEDQNDE
jgi:hypothetical protein